MNKQAFLLVLSLGFHVCLQGQTLLKTIKHPHTIYDVDMSADGDKIITAGKDTVARVWNPRGELLLEFSDHGHSISSVDYLESKETILTGAYNGEAYLWDLGGRIIAKLEGHQDAVVHVLQHEDFLATASRDHTASIWERNGKLKVQLKGHEGQVNTIVYHTSERTFLTGSRDRTIKVWSENGDLSKTIQLKNEVTDIVLMEDRVIAGHRNGSISILNARYETLKEVQAHKARISDLEVVNSVVFASAGGDKAIKFWTINGDLLQELSDHSSYVSGLSISGNRMASSSGGGDETARIWNVNPHMGLSYSCENEGFEYLNGIVGSWSVITRDRTSPGIYEDNHGFAEITPGLNGCGVSIDYKGWYRDKPYARNVQIVSKDPGVQMVTLDSEHGSYSVFSGEVKNDQMVLIWYRNKDVKKLQSKYIMTIASENAFEFSSFLSTDYGVNWALTHRRKFTRREP